MMEESEPFDIRMLYTSQKTRSDLRQETYNSLLNKVHHRVLTVSQRNDTQCIFQLPQLVMGMPLYKPFECCGYLIHVLKKEGFLVKYFHPNILYINWDTHVIASRVKELNAKDAQQRINKGTEKQNNKNVLQNLPTVNTLSYTPTGRLFL
jgi:hypothetical protein